MKAFRPNDYVQFVQANQSQIEAAEQARIYALRDLDGKLRGVNDDRASWPRARVADPTPARARCFQLGPASQQWFGYGQVGSPLRRGDFQRIGSTPDRDWSTVTGVIVYVRLRPTRPIGPIAHRPRRLLPHRRLRARHHRARRAAVRLPRHALRPAHRRRDRTAAPSRPHDRRTSTRCAARSSIDPPAYGDAAVRQRIYRRGGTLIDDWYFVGENTGDGGAVPRRPVRHWRSPPPGTLPTDHYEPVPTLDADGNTVLAQPMPALWGPLEGMLFACGDPHRPGHRLLLRRRRARPLVGVRQRRSVPALRGADARRRGRPPGLRLQPLAALLPLPEPRAASSGVHRRRPRSARAASPSRAGRSAPGRWRLIFFVAEDGIFATDGGPEELALGSDQPALLRQRGQRLPADRQVARAADALRLTVWENCLYFQYQDTAGDAPGAGLLAPAEVLAALRSSRSAPAILQGEDEAVLAHRRARHRQELHARAAPPTTAPRSPADPHRAASPAGGARRNSSATSSSTPTPAAPTSSLQVFLNEETHANTAIPISAGAAGRQRFLVDAFGDSAAEGALDRLRARAGRPPAPRPTLYQIGYAITPQPDLTNTRVTNWDDLNSPDEVWLTGVTLDCDTGGADQDDPRRARLQRRRATRVATLTRHQPPTGTSSSSPGPRSPRTWCACAPTRPTASPWLLYRADWIYVEEPPRISQLGHPLREPVGPATTPGSISTATPSAPRSRSRSGSTRCAWSTRSRAG